MKLQLVFDEQPRGDFNLNAPAEMVRAFNNQGLRGDQILFDEAVRLSQSMSFSEAEKRLQTLLLIKPGEVEGRVLLIKVLVAQRKWKEALILLEETQEKNISIPPTVIEFVRKGNDRESKRAEIEKQKFVQKERAQIDELKREIKRIRREKNLLVEENNRFAAEIKQWTHASSAISGAALCILLFFFLNPFSETVAPDEELDSPSLLSEQISSKKEEQINIQDTGSLPKNNRQKEAPKNEPSSKKHPEELKKEEPRKENIGSPKKEEPIEEPAPSSYVVQSGDTLDKIAQRFYGKKSKWRILADHNNVEPRRLRIGMKLEIPPE
jgi:LysM repeat protein